MHSLHDGLTTKTSYYFISTLQAIIRQLDDISIRPTSEMEPHEEAWLCRQANGLITFIESLDDEE